MIGKEHSIFLKSIYSICLIYIFDATADVVAVTNVVYVAAYTANVDAFVVAANNVVAAPNVAAINVDTCNC